MQRFERKRNYYFFSGEKSNIQLRSGTFMGGEHKPQEGYACRFGSDYKWEELNPPRICDSTCGEREHGCGKSKPLNDAGCSPGDYPPAPTPANADLKKRQSQSA